jgi:hypothetical protein
LRLSSGLELSPGLHQRLGDGRLAERREPGGNGPTRRDTLLRPEEPLLKIDPAGHYRLAAAANESSGDYAVNLFRYSPQQARSSQIDALPNVGFQPRRRFASQMGEK